ncbi:MAG: hypothetical protein ACYC23_24545, partial [Limisphaerales bacterium]
VSADAGCRLTAATTQGLSELATAFFPRKLAGIQAAFRLSEPAWSVSMTVERLPQTVQADVFHLFSVGEGIAYGSSVINYLVSGAPVSVLRLELSDEYFNVEFTGKNVRAWQKTTEGYQVQLHTPVSGTYTLLATYERPFKAQGEQLTFTGARPLDAQSEQGHTVIISAYEFQVKPVNVSSSLTALETGEVPAEYRLLFDAPILAAYRYTARPFNLELALEPLVQGEMISQVVDRASLTTRISEEGQVVTEARYFVKNKGTPHLRFLLPEGTDLWSVTVNQQTVVPVRDQRANLVPLPQHADPNTVNDVQIKFASKAKHARRLTLTAPVVSAPVLLAEWRLEPESGRRLTYRGGSLTPATSPSDSSGFAGLVKLFSRSSGSDAIPTVLSALGLLIVVGALRRWLARGPIHRYGIRHLGGGLLMGVAGIMALVTLNQLGGMAEALQTETPGHLQFLAPVQQPDSVLSVEVGNDPLRPGFAWGSLVLVGLALATWLATVAAAPSWLRPFGTALGWALVFWAGLRLSFGAPFFFQTVALFVILHLLLPGLIQWWRVPARPNPGDGGPVAASAALLLLGFLSMAPFDVQGQAASPAGNGSSGRAESVTQEVRVEEEFVVATAKIRWPAVKGQMLPILREPGVLTRLNVATNLARLLQVGDAGQRRQVLVAEITGVIEVEMAYQTRVVTRDGLAGFAVPVPPGLVNRLTLRIANLDVDLVAPTAVSVTRDEDAGAGRTVATLVLSPVAEAWIGWKPRARDTRRETAAFFAEFSQLYIPGAGVVEGFHEAQIRPAQGELSELVFEIPTGATITDVVTPALSVWRFDPDTRKLRVGLSPAQARPFAVLIKSQLPTGTLPFEQLTGLVRVEGAAGQVGLVGIATGGEVQLEEVEAAGMAAINLDDFPDGLL